MRSHEQKALIIVDAQRGFMPASEGERLDLPGFGELGVGDGEKIVPKINKLTKAFLKSLGKIATTQDWHPEETAHFSTTPNFVDTWPVHCVANTPGAMLHPDLIAARGNVATRFYKGDSACTSPEDDDSYSGANAHHTYPDPYERIRSDLPESEWPKMPAPKTITLPDWIKTNQAEKHVYVTGLALGDGDEHKLCVDSTAADLHDLGFNVTLVTDATEAVLPDNRAKCFKNLGEKGIRLMTTAEVLKELSYDG